MIMIIICYEMWSNEKVHNLTKSNQVLHLIARCGLKFNIYKQSQMKCNKTIRAQSPKLEVTYRSNHSFEIICITENIRFMFHSFREVES